MRINCKSQATTAKSLMKSKIDSRSFFAVTLAALIGGRIDSEFSKENVNLVAAEFDKDQYLIVKGMSSYSAHKYFTIMSPLFM